MSGPSPEMPAKRNYRILFVSHNAGRTGAPIVLLQLLRWLKQNTTHEFGIVLQNAGPLLEDFVALGPTLDLAMHGRSESVWARCLKRLWPRRTRRPKRWLRTFISKDPYDVVYCNSIVNGNVLELLSEYNLPTITHVHELAYWIQRRGEQNLRQIKQQSSAYIAVSRAVGNYLTSACAVPADQITTVYEFVAEVPPLPSADDRKRARGLLGIPADAFVLGACGAEYWRKGRDLVVHLLRALKHRSTTAPIHLVWIGIHNTEDENYQMDCDLRRAGVETMFHPIGEVPDPFLYYAAFDVFVLLSRDDPFPLVCLETAALGMPILCFEDSGGMPEFVEGDCGVVVPYLDIEAMADAVIAMQSPELRLKRGMSARRKVERQCTADTVAPTILKTIEAVASKAERSKPLASGLA